jgi:hypothetical protein
MGLFIQFYHASVDKKASRSKLAARKPRSPGVALTIHESKPTAEIMDEKLNIPAIQTKNDLIRSKAVISSIFACVHQCRNWRVSSEGSMHNHMHHLPISPQGKRRD